MNPQNLFQKNKSKLLKYFKNNNRICAVILFGSYADLTYNENSDIDLAVLYNVDYRYTTHISDIVDIEKIVGVNIDYYNLEHTNLYFKLKILQEGKIIYCSDEKMLYDFITKTQYQYYEMSYNIDQYRKYVLTHNSLE